MVVWLSLAGYGLLLVVLSTASGYGLGHLRGFRRGRKETTDTWVEFDRQKAESWQPHE